VKISQKNFLQSTYVTIKYKYIPSKSGVPISTSVHSLGEQCFVGMNKNPTTICNSKRFQNISFAAKIFVLCM